MKKENKISKMAEKISKDRFIKMALSVGFTKKQAEFLYKVCFDY